MGILRLVFPGRRQVEEALLQDGWGNVPAWDCLCAHKELGLFFGLCGRHQECRQGGEHEADEEPLTKRTRPRRSKAIGFTVLL